MRFKDYYLKEYDDYGASEFYITRLDEKIMEMVENARIAKINQKQPWHPLSLNRATKIWNDYSRNGIVRDEKGIDDISEDFIDKIITLEANTRLLGHTQQDPRGILKDLEIEYDDVLLDKLGDYIQDERGQYRISDYAMDKLNKIAFNLLTENDYEKKLLLIDSILNIVHQRSDLAKWFVQGGRQALDQLSGNKI